MASAASYLVSPAAMGRVAADPERAADRLSASYLIALAARIVREVSALVRKGEALGKRVPSLSIDTEVRFRSPEERAAFTRELTESFTQLVARYHDGKGPGGRSHRVVLIAHPMPKASTAKDAK